MSGENKTLELEDLKIQFTLEGDKALISWHGTSELQDPAASISKFLRELIPSMKGKKVVMDFRSLEYMNSATIQPLLLVLKEYNASELQTEVLYNPEVEWQRIVFRSVAAISTTLSKIAFKRS